MVKARVLIIAFTALVLGLHSTSYKVAADQEEKASCPLEIKEYQVSLVNVVSQTAGAVMPTTSMGGMMGPDVVKAETKQLMLGLKCKNMADKQISAIWWESRFTDSKENQIAKQFKSKKKIKPGKDELVEEQFPYDLNLIPNNVKVGFRIMKVEYSDKSYCDGCIVKDAESCFVYKNYVLQ